MQHLPVQLVRYAWIERVLVDLLVARAEVTRGRRALGAREHLRAGDLRGARALSVTSGRMRAGCAP